MSSPNRRSRHSKVAKSAILAPPVRLYGIANVGERCKVGKYTYIGSGTHLNPGTTVGSYCAIARYAEIGAAPHPTNFLSCHTFQYKPVHFAFVPGYEALERVTFQSDGPTSLGADVWVGAKAVIQAGVKIGTGAIIGAGAIVTKDVPPYAIVVGMPAKIMRFRFDEGLITRLLHSRWWELNAADLSGVPFDQVELALERIVDIRRRLQALAREELAPVLCNRFSGSAQGLLWVPTPHGYAEQDALREGEPVEVLAVDQEKRFKGAEAQLSPGLYRVTQPGFDEFRDCYRFRLLGPNGVYRGALGQGAVTFRLLGRAARN